MLRSLLLFSWTLLPIATSAGSPWTRHCVDDSLNGADGVRLGDFNQDGLPDIVTGWEESGIVRLYLHPGHDRASDPWPAFTVARAASPEDAVPVDLDGDGTLEIVSCHEGKRRQVLAHWAPKKLTDQLDTPNDPTQKSNGLRDWETRAFEQLDGVMWMFALPLGNIDGRTALVVGAKGPSASITLLLGPDHSDPDHDRRDLASWSHRQLRQAGWIMSLRAIDMDDDGDLDILFSDRKGNDKGVGWLEQPDAKADPGKRWKEHDIAGKGNEVMFLSATANRCLVATRNAFLLDCSRRGDRWRTLRVPLPNNVKLGKAVAPLPDDSLILTCNTHASPSPDQPGIWRRSLSGAWSALDTSSHVKFDRIETVDLDGDGDLDVLTCEERRNLGIVWYENPGDG